MRQAPPTFPGMWPAGRQAGRQAVYFILLARGVGVVASSAAAFRLPRDIIYDRIVCVCAGIALLAIATYMDVDHEGDGRGRTAETTCDRHGPM